MIRWEYAIWLQVYLSPELFGDFQVNIEPSCLHAVTLEHF